jgi:hypothetical protein
MKETGLSFTTVLLIIFVVLKLVGSIAWSWWWVLSPLWIPIALWLILIFIGLIMASVKALRYGKTKQ